jgi:diacylglycerol O-acyltransferase / wax synthase
MIGLNRQPTREDGMSRHAMPAADAAWLHMDRPTNPMVVNGLVVLGETPDPDAVLEVLEQRLAARFPRFRQRVAERPGRTPAFEDDPFFDPADHLSRIVLPAPGDRAALQAMVGDLVTPPIDRGKPLWHVHLIEGYEGGAAMLWRIHHSIADGIALGRVMLSITDDGDDGETAAPKPDGGTSALRRLAGAPLAAAAAIRGAGAGVAHEGMESLAHPEHLRELTGTALRDASTLATLLAGSADAPSELRAPLSGTRRVAWSQPVPLARVKETAHRRRVTINDLLLTALAGALHQRLGGDGRSPEEIHAMVPVNLRPLDEPVPAELGNDFALIVLALPVGTVPPAERLREVSSRMDALKSTHEAPIAFGILSAIGHTPPWVEDRLIGFFTDKASLVVTNVPGPRRPLHLAGAPVTGVLVWAPCSGSLGMTVSIFSYAGEVSVGFMTDTAAVPDPDRLVRAYEDSLGQLLPDPPQEDEQHT